MTSRASVSVSHSTVDENINIIALAGHVHYLFRISDGLGSRTHVPDTKYFTLLNHLLGTLLDFFFFEIWSLIGLKLVK